MLRGDSTSAKIGAEFGQVCSSPACFMMFPSLYRPMKAKIYIVAQLYFRNLGGACAAEQCPLVRCGQISPGRSHRPISAKNRQVLWPIESGPPAGPQLPATEVLTGIMSLVNINLSGAFTPLAKQAPNLGRRRCRLILGWASHIRPICQICLNCELLFCQLDPLPDCSPCYKLCSLIGNLRPFHDVLFLF